jgi:hypothetical protein
MIAVGKPVQLLQPDEARALRGLKHELQALVDLLKFAERAQDFNDLLRFGFVDDDGDGGCFGHKEVRR